jgi:hypothetical protein
MAGIGGVVTGDLAGTIVVQLGASVIFVYRGTAPQLCYKSHANRLTIRGGVKAIVKLKSMLVGP